MHTATEFICFEIVVNRGTQNVNWSSDVASEAEIYNLLFEMHKSAFALSSKRHIDANAAGTLASKIKTSVEEHTALLNNKEGCH